MLDSVSGSLGKLESADSKTLGKVQEPNVVSDCSDNGYDSGIKLSFSFWHCSAICTEMLDNSGEGDGVACKSRLVKSFVDDLIELGIGSALEERVKLSVISGTLMRDLR